MEGQIPEEVLTDLKNAYFEGDFTPMYHIYADLEALQDFRLGALLNLITTEPEYDYIIHTLPNYVGRLDDRTMNYFPIIKDITDNDIDAFIADTKNHLVLSRMSPMTLAYDILPEFIMQMHMCNHRCADTDRNIKLTLGTSSVIYGQQEKERLIADLTTTDGFLDVTVLNRPITDVEPESIDITNVFLIYHIGKFVRDSYIFQKMSKELEFVEKKIFALPLLELTPEEDETEEQLLSNTKVVLDTCCDFAYVERGLQKQLQ